MNFKMLREEDQMQQICRTYLHHVTCLKGLFHCSQCSRQLFFVFDTTTGSKNNYPTHWCQDVNHISTSAWEITVITIWIVFPAASLMVTYWVVWFGCGEFISIYWPCVGKSSSGGGGCPMIKHLHWLLTISNEEYVKKNEWLQISSEKFLPWYFRLENTITIVI